MRSGLLRIVLSAALLVLGAVAAEPVGGTTIRTSEQWAVHLDSAAARCNAAGILSRNALVVCALWTGLVSGGLLTAGTLLLAGATAGAHFESALAGGLPVWPALMAVLPHGVVEVPAIVAAGEFGFRGTAAAATVLRGGALDLPSTSAWVRHVLLVVALLATGAFIECHITIRAIRTVMP